VRFACAYAATATTWRTTLARERQRSQCEVIAVEAHDCDTHLCARREIIDDRTLGALSAVEDAANKSIRRSSDR
jgi:hypothetical protein